MKKQVIPFRIGQVCTDKSGVNYPVLGLTNEHVQVNNMGHPDSFRRSEVKLTADEVMLVDVHVAQNPHADTDMLHYPPVETAVIMRTVAKIWADQHIECSVDKAGTCIIEGGYIWRMTSYSTYREYDDTWYFDVSLKRS